MSAKRNDRTTPKGAVELTEEETLKVTGGAALLLPAVQKVEDEPTRVEVSPIAAGHAYKQR